MNTQQIKFCFEQAKTELDDIIDELSKGEFSGENEDVSLSIRLKVVYSYLNYSWSSRNLSMEEIGEIQQEEYELMIREIPDFCVETKMRR